MVHSNENYEKNITWALRKRFFIIISLKRRKNENDSMSRFDSWAVYIVICPQNITLMFYIKPHKSPCAHTQTITWKIRKQNNFAWTNTQIVRLWLFSCYRKSIFFLFFSLAYAFACFLCCINCKGMMGASCTNAHFTSNNCTNPFEWKISWTSSKPYISKPFRFIFMVSLLLLSREKCSVKIFLFMIISVLLPTFQLC